jgi:FkbM family methyltransferase
LQLASAYVSLSSFVPWVSSMNKSYAQLGNDLIAASFLKKSEGVIYVDIGCCFPISASNTYYFYQRGGRGLCIDPNPLLEETFKQQRPNDIFINSGVGLRDETLQYFMHVNPVYNTFSPAKARKIASRASAGKAACHQIDTRSIRVRPLSSIFEQAHFPPDFDFLSIDTEGMDEAILSSINFQKIRPSLICAEQIEDAKNIFATKLSIKMNQQGYDVVAFTGHDIYFKRRL